MNKQNQKYLIGIKSSLEKEQLLNKLKKENFKKELKLLEIFLLIDDFNNLESLENKINWIFKNYPNLKIMLHSPVDFDIKDTISLQHSNFDFYYGIMYKLSLKYKNIIGFIAHPENSSSIKGLNKNNKRLLINNIIFLRDKYPKIDEFMYVENLIGNITLKKDNFLNFLKETKIKKVCFDFAHFVSANSKENLLEILKILNDKTKFEDVYFHISDNNFFSNIANPKNIGNGEINYNQIKKYINFGIIETFSKDRNKGIEMIKDYNKFIEIKNENKI